MDSDNLKKTAFAIVGVVTVGALAWYLSGDNQGQQLDEKVHTKEKMILLLNELKLEYTCIYIRHLNMILREKAKGGELHEQFIIQLKLQMDQEKSEKFNQLCDRYPQFSMEVVNLWTEKNKSLKEIQNNAKELNQLHDEVFDKQMTTHQGFAAEMPERLTRERYIRIYTKIFATLRHDFYVSLKRDYKAENLTKITDIDPKEFAQKFALIWITFEDVRAEIFNLMLSKKSAPTSYGQPEAKKIMQQAYVTFARPDPSTPTKRWADLVTETANNHARMIERMKRGEFPASLEQNPRDTKKNDDAEPAQAFKSSMTMAPKKPAGGSMTEKKVEDPELVKKKEEDNKVLFNKFVQDAKEKKLKMEKAKEDEEKKIADAAKAEEKKPEVIAPVVEAKPEAVVEPIVEAKPEVVAPVVEAKPEVVAPVVEAKKEEAKPAVVEDKKPEPVVVKAEVVAPVVEAKPVADVAPVVEAKKEEAKPAVVVDNQPEPVVVKAEVVAPVVEAKPVAEVAPIVEAKQVEKSVEPKDVKPEAPKE